LEEEYLFKVCIFGDGGVGKTTLVQRYLTGAFRDGTTMTIGVDFHIKKIRIGDKIAKLQIWDFAGEDRFRFLMPAYVRGTKSGIFMYDLTRFSSLKNFKDWFEVFQEGIKDQEGDIPLFMIGGKLDMEDKRAVPRQTAIDIANQNNFSGFVETSAKTGQNVEVAFQTLAEILIENMEPEK